MGILIYLVGGCIVLLFAYVVIREAVRDGIYGAYKKIEKDKNK